ncbi:MAG TPA: class E sortase [Mycobacteriales bacterium]|nr:class E sortase [Mycobacteriales bacterium]
MSETLRTLLRGIGQTLITAGVVVLLFCVYELEVTNVYTGREQNRLDKALSHEWVQPAHQGPLGPELPPTARGAGFARIYLPTLGADQVHVVVEGVGHGDLKKGPGHFPGTGLPGQLGNVVISGHRTTYGAPFNRLDELHRGDAIVLETRSAFYTYTVQRLFVVKPSAIGVTFPVPDHRELTPTQRLLTLTTCNPKYSAKTRLIVRAVLSSSLVKGPGVVPPALKAA